MIISDESQSKQKMMTKANNKLSKLSMKLDENIKSMISLRNKIGSIAPTGDNMGMIKLSWQVMKLLWYTRVEFSYKIKKLNNTLINIINSSIFTYHIIPTALTKLVCTVLGLTESKEEYIDKMYTLSQVSREQMDIQFTLTGNGRSVESFSLGTVGILNPENVDIKIDMGDGTERTQEWLQRKYMKAIFKYDVIKAIATMDVTTYELNDKDEPDMNKQYKHKTIDIAPNGEVDSPNYTFSYALKAEDAIMHTWVSVQMMKILSKMIYDYCKFAIVDSIIAVDKVVQKV